MLRLSQWKTLQVPIPVEGWKVTMVKSRHFSVLSLSHIPDPEWAACQQTSAILSHNSRQCGSLPLCRTLFLQTFLSSTLIKKNSGSHILMDPILSYLNFRDFSQIFWFMCWKETYTYYFWTSETSKSYTDKMFFPFPALSKWMCLKHWH